MRWEGWLGPLSQSTESGFHSKCNEESQGSYKQGVT